MLFVVMLGVFLPIIALIIGAQWGRAYERSLWQGRLRHRSFRLSEHPDRLADALDTVRSSAGGSEGLAQAVDAIAVEVERIGESQRFLEKLLAERGTPPLSKSLSSRPGTVSSPAPPAA